MSETIRRHATHVAAVLILSTIVRGLLFHYVGIWGDAGFYTYDAMLILQGQTPFVDFIGRSPLFNYAYAGFASVVGNGIVPLRAFIVAFWVAAGVPVYLISRRVGGHLAGLASLAVYELSPFMLIYGMWANTQSMAAFLAACAVAVVLYRTDSLGYAIAGLLLGLAFLSRRSVITILGAVGLYACYLAYRDRDVRPMVARGTATVAGFGIALATGYVLMARGDLSLASKLAEVHAWGLISSSGRGGFPLITTFNPPSVVKRVGEGRIPIFHDLCQLCGAWTIRTFLKTTVASVPVLGPVLYYARDGFERFIPAELHWYASRGALAIAIYACLLALRAGYLLRVGAVVSLVAFGYVVARTELPERVMYDRELVLPLLVLFGLTAGYLYRNRVIHTYYFADFMPFLSVVTGVLYIHLYREVTA